MITLRLLGSIDLRDEHGEPVNAVLRRPKLLAILAYLAVARPRGFHRKDKLLALFWPESDQERARHALRQALYALRRGLGVEAVVSRGDEELGINVELLTTDVAEFEARQVQDRQEEAVELYRGDLLEGFFLSDAQAFEDWLEAERSRLREQALIAVRALVDRAEARGNDQAAMQWARRWMSLAPQDESAMRTLVGLLDRNDDRLGAIALYESWCRRWRDGLEFEPSPRTKELMDRIRSSMEAGNTGEKSESPDSRRSRPAEGFPVHLEAASRTSAAVATSGRPPAAGLRLTMSRRTPAIATATVVIAAVAVAVGLVFRPGGPSLVPNRISVVPFEDRTEDPEFAELGDLAAEWVTRGISRSATLEVTPASLAREAWVATRGVRTDRVRALAGRTTATYVVVGTYSVVGRQLRFQSEIIDASRGELITTLDPVTGPADSAAAVVGTLAERATAAVALHFDTELEWARYLSNPPSLDAFREYKKCLDLFQRQEWERAIEHCDAAQGLDSTYAAPIVWSAFSHLNAGRPAQADSLIRRLHFIRDRMTSLEVAVIDYARAAVTGDLGALVRAADELFRLQPERWAYGVAFQANRTNRPAKAIRVFPLVDVDAPLWETWTAYWVLFCNAYHMLGDHRHELETARRGRERHPRSHDLLNAEVIALAAVSRADDVNALVEEGFSLPPERGWDPGGVRIAVAALEYRAHGYPAAYHAAIDRAIDWYRSRSVEETGSYVRGRVLYWGEQWDEARTLFESLVAANPDSIDYLGYFGTTVARLGERDLAVAIDSQLATSDQPYSWGSHSRWRARIAAVLGEKERAVRLLRQAYDEGSAYDISLHRDIDFENLRAYPPFEEFMRPRE